MVVLFEIVHIEIAIIIQGFFILGELPHDSGFYLGHHLGK